MIKINDQLLEYLFQLANLPASVLSDKQKTKLKKDLNSILDYVNKLNQINTDNIPVFHRPYPLNDIGHNDQVKTTHFKPAFPEHHNHYLVVKRIINKSNED